MDEDGPTSQLSNPELVTLTKNLIDHAREEARVSGANDGPAKKLQPGATIDFGHRNIQELPNEVIELMKDEIERLVPSMLFVASVIARVSCAYKNFIH